MLMLRSLARSLIPALATSKRGSSACWTIVRPPPLLLGAAWSSPIPPARGLGRASAAALGPAYSTSTSSNQEERLLRRWERILSRYETSGHLSLNPSPEPPPGPATHNPGGATTYTADAAARPVQQDQAQEHVREMLRVFGSRLGGGMVPEQLSRRLVHFYSCVLQPKDRAWFFRLICSELGLNVQDIGRAMGQWRTAVDRAEAGGLAPAEALYRAADKLGGSTRPMYTQLLLPISQLEEGIGFLVRMRADLASVMQQQPAASAPLRALSEHLRQALAGWFTLGLLQLHRISWTACSGELLEKVMQYEAVHPMSAWSDLRRRLDPRDRRVFAFMHPCLPGEPLVILHTALMEQPAHDMNQLLTRGQAQGQGQGQGQGEGAQPGDKGEDVGLLGTGVERGGSGRGAAWKPSVAVFYSISSTQPGLSGVELGTFLIKKVAKAVQAEFPSVQLLVTLSPVPNFRSWLMARLSYEAAQKLPPHLGSTPQQTAAAGAAAAGGSASPGSAGGSSFPPASSPPPADRPLLSDEDGRALLAAAWCLPPEQRTQLLQAAGLGQGLGAGVAAGGELGPEAAAGSGALLPWQRYRLLSAWLQEDAWRSCPEGWSQGQQFRALFMRLAARYLLVERRRNLALDPVANFHLRNGAQLWRLNWGADSSRKGMQQSLGIMVNYRYDLDQVHERNQQYLVQHKIAAAAEVEQLLQQG